MMRIEIESASLFVYYADRMVGEVRERIGSGANPYGNRVGAAATLILGGNAAEHGIDQEAAMEDE